MTNKRRMKKTGRRKVNTFRLVTAIILVILPSMMTAGELEDHFKNPPDTARPGVYWYFMDGNQDRDEMVADLHAMKKAGIGSVLFLEVNIGVPAGPVPFMSETWQENVVHAIKTCETLGMEFILGTGPGWAGSGGSWVKPEDSMQHLVGSSLQVAGPRRFEQKLAVPPSHAPSRFAGMSRTHKAIRNQWFKDVAVLAFPTPEQGFAKIADVNIKSLKDLKPYSSDKSAAPIVMPQATYPEINAGKTIDPRKVIELTSKMKPDGTLNWEVPDGNWTIMRFVSRSTGQTTRPAPRAGHGFECDKFSPEAYRRHWDNYQGRLIEKLKPLTPGKGLTTIHLDSWEMSSQNWSAAFRDEFKKRRGYDPQPYYPAFMGLVVKSMEMTERFLWDMRMTAQELVLENHAGVIKKIAHQHGLQYSNEPYDMNPAGDIDLGSVADIPMCEFWTGTIDSQYSCIEASSIAHTMGKSRVSAESFTTAGRQYHFFPGNMKDQTDWAFAMGINGIIFHTFQHQPLGEKAKPGMTMGPYGVQWHRHRAFWPLVAGYHTYITRCSHMLRQGVSVSDILYLSTEGTPNIFVPPRSALEQRKFRDKKGCQFDAVTPRILTMRARVENGKIVFPGGSRYSMLVLPKVTTMTPETLSTVARLVNAGATVLGMPPVKSPSLVGYPACDQKVQAMAESLWGTPVSAKRTVGAGTLIMPSGEEKGIYPDYAETAAILKTMNVPEDFHSTGSIRFIHRRTDSEEIYFVSNRAAAKSDVTCTFRVGRGAPQLWDPATGETRALPVFSRTGQTTSIPMTFEAHQSFFVIFPRQTTSGAGEQAKGVNFPSLKPVATLAGSWDLAFDPERGGPAKVRFEALQDWSTHTEKGIRYYSGLATYGKSFDLPDGVEKDDTVYLDLGTVHDMCRVRLNGQDLGVVWTAPWRVDVTGVVKAAGNQLEIEVANRWNNRLVGDQQVPDTHARTLKWESGLLGGRSYKTGRYTFSTRNPCRANTRLLPSGLLGPVRIMNDL